jgi:hypothetical protein
MIQLWLFGCIASLEGLPRETVESLEFPPARILAVDTAPNSEARTCSLRRKGVAVASE